MDNGIFITGDRIASLAKEQQAWLLSLVTGGGAPSPGEVGELVLDENAGTNGSAKGGEQEDEDFAEFSPRQARDFYQGCGEKTRKAVEAIARSSTNCFQVAEVAKAVGVPAAELRGVWGGLTRRTQTIVDDVDAYLVHWHDGTQKYADDGSYIDQVGEVTEMTHQSLRKALKI